jgi:hypothetical protein
MGAGGSSLAELKAAFRKSSISDLHPAKNWGWAGCWAWRDSELCYFCYDCYFKSILIKVISKSPCSTKRI